MENRDFIVTGLQSWDIEIGSNCKNIAMEISKNNRVLYVNPPLDRLTEIHHKEAKHKAGNPLVQISNNLWVLYPQHKIESISRLPFNTLFDILNRRNNKIFAADIKQAMNKLNFSNHLHFCDSDIFRSFYLKDLLNPDMYIYYTRDNLLAVKYWQTQGLRIEPLHMAKADLVTANSTYLAKLAAAFNPNSHFIGQGCDLTAFQNPNLGPLPADISNIPKPIVGYIGALKALRLDLGVIERLATERPKWSIVLVGPEDETFAASRLHQLPNVYFLGRKNESELPSYLAAFDVAINPQVFNEVTIGNYPRKIDEYLAMGKPAVATKTEAMDYFSDYVSLAQKPDEWVSLVESEMSTNSIIKEIERKDFAADHTWEMNVSELYRYIEETKQNEHRTEGKKIAQG